MSAESPGALPQPSPRVKPPSESATAAQSGRRGIWQAWALLATGLAATALAAAYLKAHADQEARHEFEFRCQEIGDQIHARLSAHEQILRSGAAFVEHAGGVTRQEWHDFTERQRVERELPGIQGLGFALRIPRGRLAQHVAEIRAQGFPTYQVRPAAEREIYSSIVYLEPFTGRNLRALGFDMFSEPVRRAAMERAMVQDAAALSGKVVLVQETEEDVQAGTLMYVPVYHQEMPHETETQRRAALIGWVYSPYRMNDLLGGILGGRDLAGRQQVHLEIFDGDTVSPAARLFTSQSAPAAAQRTSPGRTAERRLVSAGRPWTLRFTRARPQHWALAYGNVGLVLGGGISISLLLAALFFSALNTRLQALQALQRSARASERLRECLVAFNACHDFNSALNCLVREALDLGGMDGGAAYLIEGQEAVMQTHIGLDSTLVPQLARCPLSAGYIQAAMGRPPEMFDVRERFPEALPVGAASGLRHVYVVGLAAADTSFGYLLMVSRQAEARPATDLELIRILALETTSESARGDSDGGQIGERNRKRPKMAENTEIMLRDAAKTWFETIGGTTGRMEKVCPPLEQR